MEKETIDVQKNAFDVIRYFSAFSVMFLHYTYYAITLSEQGNFFLKGLRRTAEFFPGVVILFSLSGFLISGSFERCKSRKEFFSKRIFRLYPELWVCTLVNLLVLVLLAGESLDRSMAAWLLTQVFGIANTPGCLKGFATGSVNGALWTIFTEVQLYIVLGILYPRFKKLSQKGWGVLLGAAAVLNVVCGYVTGYGNEMMAKIIERTFVPYFIWFAMGIFIYQERDHLIPAIKKNLWWLFLVFAVNQKMNLCTAGYYEDIITGMILPVVTIGFAYLLPKIRIKCDLTYGIFLYHWIFINIMVELKLFTKVPWYFGLFIFLGVTLLTAWLSWYMVGRNTKVLFDKMKRKQEAARHRHEHLL